MKGRARDGTARRVTRGAFPPSCTIGAEKKNYCELVVAFATTNSRAVSSRAQPTWLLPTLAQPSQSLSTPLPIPMEHQR